MEREEGGTRERKGKRMREAEQENWSKRERRMGGNMRKAEEEKASMS